MSVLLLVGAWAAAAFAQLVPQPQRAPQPPGQSVAPARVYQLSVGPGSVPQQVGQSGSLDISVQGPPFSALHVEIELPQGLQPEDATEERLVYDLAGSPAQSFGFSVPVKVREAGEYAITVSARVDEQFECTARLDLSVNEAGYSALGVNTSSDGKRTFALAVRNLQVAGLATLLGKLGGAAVGYEEDIGAVPVSGSGSYDETTSPAVLALGLGLGYEKAPDGSILLCPIIGPSGQRLQAGRQSVNLDYQGRYNLNAYNTDAISLLDALFATAGRQYVVDEPIRTVGVQCNASQITFEAAVAVVCETAGYAYQVQDGVHHLKPKPGAEGPAINLEY